MKNREIRFIPTQQSHCRVVKKNARTAMNLELLSLVNIRKWLETNLRTNHKNLSGKKFHKFILRGKKSYVLQLKMNKEKGKLMFGH